MGGEGEIISCDESWIIQCDTERKLCRCTAKHHQQTQKTRQKMSSLLERSLGRMVQQVQHWTTIIIWNRWKSERETTGTVLSSSGQCACSQPFLWSRQTLEHPSYLPHLEFCNVFLFLRWSLCLYKHVKQWIGRCSNLEKVYV